MPRMRRQSHRMLAAQQRDRRARSRQVLEHDSRFNSAASLFENSIRDLTLFCCARCSRMCWSHELVNDWCKPCRNACGETLFSADNGMDFGDVPEELRDLSMVEQLLIARVHPVVSVFKIRGQQTGYSGHTVNFVQRIENVANRLPHNPASLNSVILMNRSTPHGLVQFRVRSGRVRRALMWLRTNNQYYCDIIIDEEELISLPEDDDITHLLPVGPSDGGEEQQNLPEDPDNIISTSGVPNVPSLDAASSIDRHLQRIVPISSQHDQLSGEPINWPEIEQARLNEFVTEGLMCKAFPCLFPYGRGDLRAPRRRTINPHKYFQYLMDYKDGRFANDARFPYYAYNTMARWDAINCGNVYIRQNNMQGVSYEHLRQMANDPDRNLASQIMYYGTSLRGTRSYWKQRASELDAMVRQLGTPTIFFTLSAADYHWPDLYRLLSENPGSLDDRARFKLMHENPLITAKFFETRCLIFVERFLKKFFDISDSWFRFEWQHRGSPHVHGMLWFKDAPDCSTLDSLDEDGIDLISLYFDELVSATVANRYNITPRDNPCRRRYIDLSVEEKSRDLDRILSAVQIHSRCGPHCIRKRRATLNFECRYGFPIDLEEQSSLRKEDNIWKFFPKRNDSFIQRHNRFVSQVWRGNTDFSPITSNDAVIRYISKYASKGEHASESYAEMLKRFTTQSSTESAPATLIRQLMVSTVAERNFSAQEVMHLVMGWPLYHATRSFTILSTTERWYRLGQEPQDSIIKYYSTRIDLDDLSLYDFAKSYRVEKKCIKRRSKDCIVRIFPHLKVTGDLVADAAYYEQQCKLYIPWRGDFKDCLPHDSTWQELHDTHIAENINRDNPLGDAHSIPDESDFDDNPLDHACIVRDAGMAAARLHPGVPDTDPIGHRPIDEAFVWPDTRVAGLSSERLSVFFREFRDSPDPSRNHNNSIPFGSLSPVQQNVVNICQSQIQDPNYPIKRVLVQGKAGTGKSAVIKCLCGLIDQSSDPDHITFEVLAPTGAAALNVDGKTIHSFLNISATTIYTPLNGEMLRNFQLRLQYLKFLIIDEYSMVGMRLLTKIHKRLREAKPESIEPFAGINLYLFGDMRQLPPVMDIAIYMQPRDEFSALAAGLVQSIQQKFFLTVCHRQSGDQEDFRRALDNLACGASTEQDWQLFMSRRASIAPPNHNTFRNAINLFPTNLQVKEHNNRALAMNGMPIAVIEAEHNCPAAYQSDDSHAQGLSSVLYLTRGCRIMLRKNLDVSRGLVNGSLGTLREIIYRQDERPPKLPYVLLIQFDKYHGPFITDQLFPLLPTQVSWVERGIECKRKQFPINLAYALTVHKSQGLTLDKAIVDIGSRETSPGQTYVALSRVRKLDDLMLANSFDLTRLTAIGKLKHISARESFLQDMSR